MVANGVFHYVLLQERLELERLHPVLESLFDVAIGAHDKLPKVPFDWCADLSGEKLEQRVVHRDLITNVKFVLVSFHPHLVENFKVYIVLFFHV